MNIRGLHLAMLFLFLIFSYEAAQAGVLHHSIKISLYPPDRSLKATDSISIDVGNVPDGGEVELRFLLNKSLSVEEVTSDASITNLFTQESFDPTLFKPEPDSADIDMIKRSKGLFVKIRDLPHSDPILVCISYSGVLYDSLISPTPNYPKATPTTSGLIDPQGVYLCNQSVWYPIVFDQKFSFSLTVDTPFDWMPLSQGRRSFERIETIGGEQRLITGWAEKGLMEEIYLVAARFYRYERYSGGVGLMAYLREPDDSLANCYIEAAGNYIAMYENLIGKYPFDKFALVENFWQTGFGMPSFTLLGDRVTRLPFIVKTSYGHEILHNWWGNSVYVDYAKGNWCEGLTTYCADYLYKEMQSPEDAREYRHNTLIGYINNVDSEKEFPLSRFRERYDAASQSIGYGKSLMVFHMLRTQIGDSLFWEGLRSFYDEFKFKTASWDDLARTFSRITGKDYSWFFNQWVNTKGAPYIRIAHADWKETEGGFKIDLTLAQDEPPFVLDIPVVILTDHGEEKCNVRLSEPKQDFSLKSRARPITLKIDPGYDLMRRLDIDEIPMTIGGLFAQKSLIGVIGNQLDQEQRQKMVVIANKWGLEEKLYDEEDVSEEMLQSHSIWFLGQGELARSMIEKAYESVRIDDGLLRMGDKEMEIADGTAIFTIRNPDKKTLAFGFVLSQDIDGFLEVAPRVPHYSTYSYLGFRKQQMEIKGIWQQNVSPLVIDFQAR
ncbi:MAG: M1 family metallopeptidase [bacterium]